MAFGTFLLSNCATPLKSRIPATVHDNHRAKTWGAPKCGFESFKPAPLNSMLFNASIVHPVAFSSKDVQLLDMKKNEMKSHIEMLRKEMFFMGGKHHLLNPELHIAFLGGYEQENNLPPNSTTLKGLVFSGEVQVLKIEEVKSSAGAGRLFYFEVGPDGVNKYGFIANDQGDLVGGNSDGDYWCF